MNAHAQKRAVNNLGSPGGLSSETLQPASDTDAVLRLQAVVHLLQVTFDKRVFRIILETPESGHSHAGPLPVAASSEPSRRLGNQEDADAEREGEDDSQADDDAPRGARVLDGAHSVVDDVGDEDAESDEELVSGHDCAANLPRRALGLEHGDSHGEVTDAQTGNESAHHEMHPAVHGGNLDDVADDEDAHSKAQALASPPPIRGAIMPGVLACYICDTAGVRIHVEGHHTY